MGSATFTLTGNDDDSDSVVLASGEIGRVRFTSFPARADVKLGITRNAVTTFLTISSTKQHGNIEQNERSYFMEGMPGDTIFVRASCSENVEGIVEGVTTP